jgi:hypothetical protein
MRDREVPSYLRRECFIRDGFRCVMCFKRSNIDAHHFTPNTHNSSVTWPYEPKNPYVDTKLEDLVTLDDSCHRKAETCDRTSPFYTLLQALVIRNRQVIAVKEVA